MGKSPFFVPAGPGQVISSSPFCPRLYDTKLSCSCGSFLSISPSQLLSPQVCSLISPSLPTYTLSCEDNLNENLPTEEPIAMLTTSSSVKKSNHFTYLGCMYASLFTYEAIISITSEVIEEKDLDPSSCQTACMAVPGDMR